jgi:type IV secretory pathway VirB10-like protein
MMKWTNLVRALATTMLVAFLVVSLIGCQQQADKTKECNKPCDKPCDKAKAEPAKPMPPPPPPAKPAQPMPPPAAKPVPPPPPPPAPKPSAQAQPAPQPMVQKTTETPGKPQTPEAQSAEKRAQIEDVIYAEMRVKMEQMIAQRAQLMKSGKDSSDPEVQKLEASILRAKKFLTDAGEVVGDINPPIKEQAPAPK